MASQLGSFISIADAIASLFAPHVEVVLHDAADGRITHIANAFSKRRRGDESLIEDDLTLADANPVSSVYAKAKWNGRHLRSISVRLTDDEGTLLGFLCINHDIEALLAAQEALLQLISLQAPTTPPRQLFAQDWREEVNGLVSEFLRERSLTLEGATTVDQDDLLRALDKRGVFEVRNAPSYVASIFGWSRQTLYARLKVARSRLATNPAPLGETMA